jgi:hypothetical protein
MLTNSDKAHLQEFLSSSESESDDESELFQSILSLGGSFEKKVCRMQ